MALSADSTSSGSTVRRLLDAFRQQWAAGTPPEIEEVLREVGNGSSVSLLASLIEVEVQHRIQAGEAPGVDEYIARFPNDSATVRAAFTALSEVTRIADVVGSVPPRELPRQLGKYRVVRLLGAGSFGSVYLARDPDLQRDVAIKVLRPQPDDADSVMTEAQNAAALRHPAIVTIYSIERSGDSWYIIQEYVAGCTLREAIARGEPASIDDRVALLKSVADAVAHAHAHRIIHRDLKPGNILLDEAFRPRVIDFGLAVQERRLGERRGEIAGTLRYMSPEQVRGETHRLDDRSDIWSLGVILYQLLCNRLPFRGAGSRELAEEIQFRDPIPLRQINPEIPRELERITLRCLAKRMADRYSLCADLIEDLERFLTAGERNPVAAASSVSAAFPGSGTGSVVPGDTGSLFETRDSVPIVPRGLASFAQADAEFYPTLLPGPFDRHGIPASIAFWLQRIRSFDLDAFPVGIVYGRSGAGKSSLIRAGILPRLPDNIDQVYVDCTDSGTDEALLAALRRGSRVGSDSEDLVELLGAIRAEYSASPHRKMLIVFDQFEQWLHAHASCDESPLALALRQCDGHSLQALLIVRDDFWLGISRFMHAVEIPIAEGQNTMAVELFGRRHARRVLARFGVAYGCLPELRSQMTADHERFLDEAVDGLAENDLVPSVAIALFAHMLRNENWQRSVLKAIGGARAVGVRFLEEVFEGDQAPLLMRQHGSSARTILAMLLPQHGADIKGHTRSFREFIEATGLDRSQLAGLLTSLDRELSLITPAASADEHPSADEDLQRYRLAHDYIVAPIHEWLTRKEKETMRGRARVRLRELAQRWDQTRQTRLLPSTLEYLWFRALVPRRAMLDRERRYLRAGSRRSTTWVAVAIGVLLLSGFAVSRYRERVRVAVVQQVGSLGGVESSKLRAALEALRSRREVALTALEDASDTLDAADDQRRRGLAMAWLGVIDGEQIVRYADEYDEREGRLLLEVLRRQHIAALRSAAADVQDGRRQGAVAALLFLLGDQASAVGVVRIDGDPGSRTEFIRRLGEWTQDWQPIQRVLAHRDSPKLLKSALLSASAVAWPRIPAELREGILESARDLKSDPDGLLHSVALHCLELSGETVGGPSDLKAGFDWYVNSQGMVLLRVGRTRSASDLHQLFMSDREVSVGLFRKFYNQQPAAAGLPPSWALLGDPEDELPVRKLTLTECCQFCNWLSTLESLTPAYHQEDEYWILDPDSEGYRLPFIAETHHAACGGSDARFFWGNDTRTEVTGLFCVSAEVARVTEGENPYRVPARCASRLPNNYGFFDALGNVGERCWDDDPTVPDFKRVYGSDCTTEVRWQELGNSGSIVSNSRPHGGAYIGFRVVRRVREK